MFRWSMLYWIFWVSSDRAEKQDLFNLKPFRWSISFGSAIGVLGIAFSQRFL
jgi:hypothetical protein